MAISFIDLFIPVRQLPVIIMCSCQPKSHQLIKYGSKLFQLNSRLVLSTFVKLKPDNCEREGESSSASIEWCARVAAQLFGPSAECTSSPSQVQRYSVGLQLSRRHVLLTWSSISILLFRWWRHLLFPTCTLAFVTPTRVELGNYYWCSGFNPIE